ncbi:hypothetical protein b3_0246 [Synechococcus phage B3]|nr:hypothetical protein b3_0246 [Synechococcus phage B3]QGT54854.1 hypothetical protein b23_0240 [Synechococcus phage B23]
MLTPLDFRNSFNKIMAEIEVKDLPVNIFIQQENYKKILADVDKTDTFTEYQWRKLVRVCRAIKEYETRFSMDDWHYKKGCGTTHCLAGWTLALEYGDIDIDDINVDDRRMLVPDDYMNDEYLSTPKTAEFFLSKYTRPFFFFTNRVDGVNKDAERLVMKYFIEPILQEDDKDKLNSF